MDATRVGKRGLLFRFDKTNSPFSEPTFVYAIVADKRVFICDTHVGPESMIPIQREIQEACGTKELVVFNSHLDWDHVWGNCAFPGATILAHKKCREGLENDALWEHMLNTSGEMQSGKVERVLPTLTFTGELNFHDDGVMFFHSPGHTEDSSSCFDEREGVLFVGDNIEDPIPHLQWHRLDEYERTLRRYQEMRPRTIIAAHNGIPDLSLVGRSLDYISRVRSGERVAFEQATTARVHTYNLRALVFSKYEEKAKAELAGAYSFADLMAVMESKGRASLAELEDALARYIEREKIALSEVIRH